MIPYGLQTRPSGPADVAADTLCVCPMAFGLWVYRTCNNNDNNDNGAVVRIAYDLAPACGRSPLSYIYSESCLESKKGAKLL